MNKNELITNITRTFNKIGFECKKHAPEVLIVAGIAGVVTSAVMACKATTKASTITNKLKDDMDKLHDTADLYPEEYSQEDLKKDTAIVYTQAAVKYVKLYGPSVALGALSLTCILASNNILRKRNVAIAAAYATIDRSFKDYRGRVIERFGKELDRELRYNIKAKEFKETVVDEKGKEKVVKKTVSIADPNTYSDYARFYDDGCLGWTKDPELNLCFLRNQMAWANEKLKAKGYLFLNEVYESLGIPATKAGQIVGWIYDEKNPIGDNFVDFGIYDTNREAVRDFVNGYERTILLDFNVDGNILNYIN